MRQQWLRVIVAGMLDELIASLPVQTLSNYARRRCGMHLMDACNSYASSETRGRILAKVVSVLGNIQDEEQM